MMKESKRNSSKTYRDLLRKQTRTKIEKKQRIVTINECRAILMREKKNEHPNETKENEEKPKRTKRSNTIEIVSRECE